MPSNEVMGIEDKLEQGALNHQGLRTSNRTHTLHPQQNAALLHYHWRLGNCYYDPGGARGLHGRAVVTLDPR